MFLNLVCFRVQQKQKNVNNRESIRRVEEMVAYEVELNATREVYEKKRAEQLVTVVPDNSLTKMDKTQTKYFK